MSRFIWNGSQKETREDILRPFVHLPADIITDILLMLPVKSLIRFKGVCKSWSAVITDHRFDSMRQKIVTTRSGTYSWGCMLEIVNESRGSSLVSRTLWFSDFDVATELPDELRIIFKTRIRPLGPCNGVYLLNDSYGNLALWNHATRDYRILTQGNDDSNQCPSYGFVSQECAQGASVDFLVLRLHFKESDSKRGVLESYSFSTRVWKKLKPLPEDYRVHHLTTTSEYINGVFYWIASWNDSSFSISFDTRSETYEKLDFPNNIGDTPGKPTQLACYTINGYTSLAYAIFNTENNDLWLMKQVTNAGKCWVKIATVNRTRFDESEVNGRNRKVYTGRPLYRYEESLVSLS